MDELNNKLPKIDLYGKEIPKGSVFFKIPKNIGTILMASTSLLEGHPQETTSLKWIWKSKKNSGACWYIGDNGFAAFSFDKSVDNAKGIEINFDNVTDLHKGLTKKYVNYILIGSEYQHTDYWFLYMNNSTPVFQIEEKYNNENEEEGKYTFLYNFLSLAEKQWTNKLISRMPSDIKEKGFISFNYVADKYRIKVNLGISFIEYASLDNQHTLRYEKDEIHSLSFVNGGLVMTLKTKKEEKHFFGLFQKIKDEQIGFSLQHLSNQSYFLYALRTLWNINL